LQRASAYNIDLSGYGFGFAGGGISTGPMSGYPTTLHGTEAIIPLEKGNLTLDIPSIKELLAEVKMLRQELVSAQVNNTKANQDTAYYTERNYIEAKQEAA